MALVITIIVLLILAGVSISAVVGENGILTQAQNSVTKSKKSAVEEEIEMAIASCIADSYTVGASMGTMVMPTSTGGMYYDGTNVYYYSEENGAYKGSLSTDGANRVENLVKQEVTGDELKEYQQIVKAAHPEKHIPTGFAYKEGSINEGYVITDGTNEFVWIPVAMTSEYTKRMGTRNYHLRKQDQSDNLSASLTAATLLACVGTDNIGTFPTNSVITASGEGVTPEKTAVCNAGGFWVGRYETGVANVTRESSTSPTVNKDVIKVAAGLEPARNVTQTNALGCANSWKTVAANEEKGTVAAQSGLITGTQWDKMCEYIGWSICDSNCGTWGNYYNVASKKYSKVWHSKADNCTWVETENFAKEVNTKIVFATGTYENVAGGTTKKRNIYDVAGNVWEWTTEYTYQDHAGSNPHVVRRGGGTNFSSSGDFATCRGGDYTPGGYGWNIGFRLVLYVQ